MSAQVNFGIGVNCTTCCGGAAPCTCGTAKQIVGVKHWLGYSGSFNFPGFKACWMYGVYDSDGAYEPTTGHWIYNVGSLQLDGGSMAAAVVALTSGGGYSSISGMTGEVTGGTGTGAVFSCVIGSSAFLSVSVSDPGTGYSVSDVLTLVGGTLSGGGSAATITVLSVDGSGAIASAHVFTHPCTGSAPNFAAGDLVLWEIPAAGPMTDYLTGISQSYPKIYSVYVCTNAITGSATNPALDGSHFALWDYGNEGSYPDQQGPTVFPMADSFALYSATTDTARLEVTTTTVLDNFPLFPATFSAAELATFGGGLGANGDGSANSFSDMTGAQCGADGTFAYDWTIPTVTADSMTFPADSASPTYTPPSTLPSTEQAKLLAGAGFVGYHVPPLPVVGYSPTYNGGTPNLVVSVFIISGTQAPGLVTWSYNSSQITFQLAYWSWNTDVEYEFLPFHYGALASAPATVTQTVALNAGVGAGSYTLTQVAANATALMNSTDAGSATFANMPCNATRWNSYSLTGAVVASSTGPDDTYLGTLETTGGSQFVGAYYGNASCKVGSTPMAGAASMNGCKFFGLIDDNYTYFMTKSQVTPCAGTACVRSYNCPTVTCATFTADGTTGYTLDPTAAAGTLLATLSMAALTPGESAVVYQTVSGSTGSCSCT